MTYGPILSREHLRFQPRLDTVPKVAYLGVFEIDPQTILLPGTRKAYSELTEISSDEYDILSNLTAELRFSLHLGASRRKFYKNLKKSRKPLQHLAAQIRVHI